MIGLLCGWVGYLTTRERIAEKIGPYLLVGIIGSMIGGALSIGIGVTEDGALLDANSLLYALIVSGVSMIIYAILLSFFGRASSS